MFESLPAREGTVKQAGGAARKYLLYVIGEILLVMIGILLALQANNWNQSRIEKKQSAQVLLSIKEELQENLAILETCLQNTDRRRSDLDVVRSFIGEKNIPIDVDSLNLLLGKGMGDIVTCHLSTDVVSDAKNSGIFIKILSQELRVLISRWARQLDLLKSEENSWSNQFVNEILPFTYDKIAWNDVDYLIKLSESGKIDQRFFRSKFAVDPRDHMHTLKFENLAAIQYWRMWKYQAILQHIKLETQDLISAIEAEK